MAPTTPDYRAVAFTPVARPSWLSFGWLNNVNIIVNDRPHSLEPGATVLDLLESLDIRVRHVAVEVNGELVPREQHAAHRLESEDRIEVVTLVGGG